MFLPRFMGGIFARQPNRMKTLVLALFFFGALGYGCYDVKPFKAARRVLRRTPKRQQTAPLQAESGYYDDPAPQPPLRRRPYR